MSLEVQRGRLGYNCLFQIRRGGGLLTICKVLPFLVPRDRRDTTVLLVARVGCSVLVNGLRVSVGSNRVHCGRTVSIRAVNVGSRVVRRLLRDIVTVAAMTGRLFDSLLGGRCPTRSVRALLARLHRRSSSHAFFLPARFIRWEYLDWGMICLEGSLGLRGPFGLGDLTGCGSIVHLFSAPLSHLVGGLLGAPCRLLGASTLGRCTGGYLLQHLSLFHA